MGNSGSKEHSLYIEMNNNLLKIREMPVKFPELVCFQKKTLNSHTWEKVAKKLKVRLGEKNSTNLSRSL